MTFDMGTALVGCLAGIAAICSIISVALTLQMRRVSLTVSRAQADLGSQLDRLEAAQAPLSSLIAENRSQLASVSRQQATDAAFARQRFETTVGRFAQVDDRMDDLRREITAGQDRSRETLDRQLQAIREDNARQLDRMRETVDEKLSRTLNDRLSVSFKQVSDQLETVSRGLGEMQGVAAGVGDLKRVLAGVKTRGILGEVQLGAILSEILAPDQYAENIATVPGSSDRVEFAVRIPVDGGAPVWLPIDSKFPGDTYAHLRDALDSGEAPRIDAARKLLDKQIKAEASDISSKYLSVPSTTAFGIMFLPFEGLYAEVVDRPGLIEALQRDYRVAVAGPSTMAVILNSLQMSYQTFAFQKRADEIQRVLAAVKAEFPRYQAELRRALKQIETAGKTVDGIINTRTNVIERKLRDVTALDGDEDGSALADELASGSMPAIAPATAAKGDE